MGQIRDKTSQRTHALRPDDLLDFGNEPALEPDHFAIRIKELVKKVAALRSRLDKLCEKHE